MWRFTGKHWQLTALIILVVFQIVAIYEGWVLLTIGDFLHSGDSLYITFHALIMLTYKIEQKRRAYLHNRRSMRVVRSPLAKELSKDFPEKKVYILLNKPKNFTTALDEGQEFRNVLELVKGSTNAKIGVVGRMAKNTTGLLLFTNDTDMIRKFTLPTNKSSKIYQVSLDKNLKFEDLEKIQKGLVLDGHRVFVEDVSYTDGEAKSEIGLQLRSSNVKVVRSIFEHFSYDVLRIDRVSFAGLTKKNLPRGNWRLLTEQEIINLKNV